VHSGYDGSTGFGSDRTAEEGGARELSEKRISRYSSGAKKIRGWTETNTVFVVLLLAGLVFYFLIQLSSPASTRSRQRQVESWNTARTALDNFQYDKAAEIAQRLTEKTPNYYYGYAYQGYIALERNQLKDAEGYFARAYELFPTDEAKQPLEAVRKRLAAESPK